MSRCRALPGWASDHFRLVLVLTVVFAVILRIPPHRDGATVEHSPADSYLPVAAAIGLSPDIPEKASLATWVNAAIYSVGLNALTLAHPDLSPVDYGAAFLSDPAGFSALGRFAAIVASATSVCLIWLIISDLSDRSVATAAALIFAVHPAAVAFTSGVGSGAFPLLFMLCGILIITRTDWREARPVEFATVGLSLGFAAGTIPLTAVVLVVGLLVAAYHAAPTGRLASAARTAIGIAFFTVAAALVITSDQVATIAATAVFSGILLVAAAIVIGYALRSLRSLVGEATYSAAVLSMGTAISAIAIANAPVWAPPDESPVLHASDWMSNHLPADSVVVIDSRLGESVSLPRNASSWRREARLADSTHTPAPMQTLAAAEAAARMPGPLYDVIISTPTESLSALMTRSGHSGDIHYLVLPDTVDPHSLAADGRFWLVARFRGSAETGCGVAIWGTQASPHVKPVHVEWRMSGSRMLARLPSTAS